MQYNTIIIVNVSSARVLLRARHACPLTVSLRSTSLIISIELLPLLPKPETRRRPTVAALPLSLPPTSQVADPSLWLKGLRRRYRIGLWPLPSLVTTASHGAVPRRHLLLPLQLLMLFFGLATTPHQQSQLSHAAAARRGELPLHNVNLAPAPV